MENGMIKLADLTPHPLNSEIFTTSDKDNLELRSQIEMHGVIVPILVNRRKGGKLRIISGHRRVDHSVIMGHTEIKGEIISVGDAEELLLLFACNVGRDLKEAYKVRFFKQVKQFLRQKNQLPVESGVLGSYPTEGDPFVQILHRLGADATKMRMWEVIQKITGFSKTEQETLTHVCDEEYRKSVLDGLTGVIKTKEINRIAGDWMSLELAITNGEMTIAKVDKEVKTLLKQIDALKNPQNDKDKPKKEKPAPFKVEKATEKNASIFTNTTENTYAHIYSMAKRDKKDVPEECKYSFNEVVAMAQRWAELVLENV